MASILKTTLLHSVCRIWALGNGLLHDIFVLERGQSHSKENWSVCWLMAIYWSFSGIIYLLCYNGIKEGRIICLLVSIVIAHISIGQFIGLIFKVLPSIGTILTKCYRTERGWSFPYSTLPGRIHSKADHVMTKFDAPFIIRISVGHFSTGTIRVGYSKVSRIRNKTPPCYRKSWKVAWSTWQ